MLLDVILRSMAQDNTLTIRKWCREGVCGSDAVNLEMRAKRGSRKKFEAALAKVPAIVAEERDRK